MLFMGCNEYVRILFLNLLIRVYLCLNAMVDTNCLFNRLYIHNTRNKLTSSQND